jgi:hypothetical protein
MANTAQKLIALGFENLTDFIVRADENGERIQWLSQSPQPTQTQLDAVTDQQAIDALNNRLVKQAFELSRKDKVLIKWIAQRTGGGTAQSIKAELKAIWDSTS